MTQGKDWIWSQIKHLCQLAACILRLMRLTAVPRTYPFFLTSGNPNINMRVPYYLESLNPGFWGLRQIDPVIHLLKALLSGFLLCSKTNPDLHLALRFPRVPCLLWSLQPHSMPLFSCPQCFTLTHFQSFQQVISEPCIFYLTGTFLFQ